MKACKVVFGTDWLVKYAITKKLVSLGGTVCLTIYTKKKNCSTKEKKKKKRVQNSKELISLFHRACGGFPSSKLDTLDVPSSLSAS